MMFYDACLDRDVVIFYLKWSVGVPMKQYRVTGIVGVVMWKEAEERGFTRTP